MKKILLLALLMLALVFIATPVMADTFYFTSDHSTDGLGTAPFGEVELTQNGADVDFKVSLYDGSEFIRTGAGKNMNFLFNGIDIILADISGTGLTAETGTYSFGDMGVLYFGIYYTDQGKTGASDSRPGPIEFTVANASIAELTVPNSEGVIFLADIISGQTGYTGVVDVTLTQVPEPTMLILLGLGLVGIAGIRKK